MTIKYDVVYFWYPHQSKWVTYELEHPHDADEVILKLNNGGIVAKAGKLSIGAPEGPPSDGELESVREQHKRWVAEWAARFAERYKVSDAEIVRVVRGLYVVEDDDNG